MRLGTRYQLTYGTWYPANIIHLSGSGDDFQTTGTIRYPDGSVWHYVTFMTLRGGKIWRETTYFAQPFEAPEWRAPYAERID